MTTDQKWRDHSNDVVPEGFEDHIETVYLQELKDSVSRGYIREHFEKEIQTDLIRLIDLNHKIDDKMRGAIIGVLDRNFDGAQIDMSLVTATSSEHEYWENNLRRLMIAVFRFANDSSQRMYDEMCFADPQENGVYDKSK